MKTKKRILTLILIFAMMLGFVQTTPIIAARPGYPSNTGNNRAVQLVAREGVVWATHSPSTQFKSAPLTITKSGTYSLTVNTQGYRNLTDITIVSEGGYPSTSSGWNDVDHAPADWWNAQITIIEVKVNSSVVVNTFGTRYLVEESGSRPGYVFAWFWAGWDSARRRLDSPGVVVGDDGLGLAFALPGNSPINSVTVEFTVTGIDTVYCEHCKMLDNCKCELCLECEMPEYNCICPPTPIDGALRVVYSHEAGFYNQAFDLTLQTIEGADIYYTTNSSTPTTSSTEYVKQIRVDMPGTGVNVFTVSAIAFKDGKKSRVYTQSFVRGTGVFQRFGEDVLVFALNSDPYGLYDHYDGILVEGIDRANYLKGRGFNPQVDPMLSIYYPYTGNSPSTEVYPNAPANYNRTGRENEREVYVEMFDNKGNIHISQMAGMRVKGGFSRAAAQKSLELYARTDYGDSNLFLYDFFGEQHSDDGNLMHRYRRVRLRNGGSDRLESWGSMMRDELGQELFKQAGHPDGQVHTPAAVFLNGEYYGFAWLKSPRTEDHLWRKYGGNEDNYETFAVGEPTYHEGYDDNGNRTRGGSDWESLIAYARGGLTDDERFEAFSKRLDIDNFMRYYAAQIYTHNLDWPNHNIEVWRYFPNEGETVESEYLDGKWRFVAQDLESGWGIYSAVGMWQNNSIKAVLEGGNQFGYWNANTPSAFLNAILARPEMRAKFANTLVDLMEGAFSSGNVNAVLDSLVAKSINEINNAVLLRGGYEGANGIRNFANNRPSAMYNHINTTLGFNKDNRTAVSLQVMSRGEAVMNSRPVGELQTVICNYYMGTLIEFKARPHPGYIVDYWEVNGVRQSYGENVISVYIDSAVNAVLHFKKDSHYMENGRLHISAVQARDGGTETGNWIEISNDTGKVISTKGLFLTDSNYRFQWKMPAVIIREGETVLVRALSNNHSPSLKRMQANFGISFGERLRMYCSGTGQYLQKVEIASMTPQQVQERGTDGRFKVVDIIAD